MISLASLSERLYLRDIGPFVLGGIKRLVSRGLAAITTGVVMLSHEGFLAHLLDLDRQCGRDGDPRHLSCYIGGSSSAPRTVPPSVASYALTLK